MITFSIPNVCCSFCEHTLWWALQVVGKNDILLLEINLLFLSE